MVGVGDLEGRHQRQDGLDREVGARDGAAHGAPGGHAPRRRAGLSSALWRHVGPPAGPLGAPGTLITVCADANITKSMVEVFCGAASEPVAAMALAMKLVKRAALRLRGEPGMTPRSAGAGEPAHSHRWMATVGCRAQRRRPQSQREVAKERATKRLATAVEQARPGRRAYPNKKEGVVSIDRGPVARVVVSADRNAEFKLEFNQAVVEELQLDKDGVRRH